MACGGCVSLAEVAPPEQSGRLRRPGGLGPGCFPGHRKGTQTPPGPPLQPPPRARAARGGGQPQARDRPDARQLCWPGRGEVRAAACRHLVSLWGSAPSTAESPGAVAQASLPPESRAGRAPARVGGRGAGSGSFLHKTSHTDFAIGWDKGAYNPGGTALTETRRSRLGYACTHGLWSTPRGAMATCIRCHAVRLPLGFYMCVLW